MKYDIDMTVYNDLPASAAFKRYFDKALSVCLLWEKILPRILSETVDKELIHLLTFLCTYAMDEMSIHRN